MTIQYTHKTRDGRPARIICTDRQNTKRPVVALVQSKDGEECPQFLRSDLRSLETDEVPFLTEKSIWEDVAVDTPVWVKDGFDGVFVPKHFAKYDKKYVYVWKAGCTSHTSDASSTEPSIAYHPSRVFLENPAYA